MAAAVAAVFGRAPGACHASSSQLEVCWWNEQKASALLSFAIALAIAIAIGIVDAISDGIGDAIIVANSDCPPLLMQPTVSEAAKHFQELNESAELAAAFEAFDAAIRNI